MATIDDFVRQFAAQLTQGSALDDVSEPVPPASLTGILLAVSEEAMTFSHLGLTFQVSKSDVLQVEESSTPIPNPFGRGVACVLVVKGDAYLTRSVRVLAKDLAQNVPYVVARPSQIQPFSAADHAAQQRELDWLAQRGLQIPTEAEFANSAADLMATTYTGTQSSQVTATRTNTQSAGMSDDNSVDDTPSDSMGRDDASPDDMSRDVSTSAMPTTTYTGTQSSQTTSTRTNTQSAGMSDDSSVDDTPSDGMGRDDANQDDM